MGSKMKKHAVANGNRSPQSERRNESLLARNPENFFQLGLHILNSVGRFRKVLMAVGIAAGACFLTWSQMPEQGKLLVVNRLLDRNPAPAAGFYPSVDIEESAVNVDLSEWTAVPPGGDRNHFCKVTTLESLTARRIQKSAHDLARRAATTGARPDFYSQTHKLTVQLSDDNRVAGPRMTDYDVLLDISAEPLGRPFKAELRSIRMGSFSDQNREWTATTILQPTGKVTVKVIFPKWKVGKNLRFTRSDMTDGANYVDVSEPKIVVGENSIEWTIDQPKLGYAYRIDWDW